MTRSEYQAAYYREHAARKKAAAAARRERLRGGPPNAPLSDEERRQRRAESARRWRATNPGWRKAYEAANTEKIKTRRADYRNRKKAEEKARSAEYNRRNRGLILARVRERKYGMPADEQARVLAEQGNACAVCRASFSGTPHLDHDHDTGEARGFLCSACNKAIGIMKDSPSRLRAAAAYLDRRAPKLRLVK